MNLLQILEEDNETIVKVENLEESFFVTPFLALSSFSKGALNKLTSDKAIRKLRAKATLAKEKLRSKVGISGKAQDAPVYSFTKEQQELVNRIIKKYGSEIIDDIKKFRKEVLAPYEVIKRIVRKNRSVTDKETLGLSQQEFKRAYETAKNKIKKRGEVLEKIEEIENKISNRNLRITNLRKALKDFENDGKINRTILNKLLSLYDLSDKEFSNYDLEDLKKAYDSIVGVRRELEKYEKSPDEEGEGEVTKAIKRRLIAQKRMKPEKNQLVAKKGKTSFDDDDESLVLIKKDKFYDEKGLEGFNTALGSYFLRRDIIDKLEKKLPDSVYTKTYKKIINEMIDEEQKRIKKDLEKISNIKSSVEFNKTERKIFEPKTGLKYSSNIKDYEQKIKEDDFEGVKYIKRPKEVKEAEDAILAAIKKFERRLKKELDESDFNELKEKKIIGGTLLTISELPKASEIFKKEEEIEKKSEEDSEEEE